MYETDARRAGTSRQLNRFPVSSLFCRHFARRLSCFPIAVCIFSLAPVVSADTAGMEGREVRVPSVEVQHARDLVPNYPEGARLELPELSEDEERKIVGLIREKTRSYVSISRPVGVAESNWRRVGSKGGHSIWQLHVRSPGALETKVWFSGFDLDAGMSVKVYGVDTSAGVVGEYTGRGLMEMTDFWSLSVRGDTAVVEFWVPSPSHDALEPADFPFRIPSLDHRFRDEAGDIPPLKYHSMAAPQSHTSCLFENDLCVFPDGVERPRGVAGIIYTPPPGQGSGGQCTAGLINAGPPPSASTPKGVYLLTAYHCIEGGTHPEMRRGTLLNLGIAIGVSPCVPEDQRITGQGAQFIAGHRRGDYALLWIDIDNLASQTTSPYVILLGWSSQPLPTGSLIETLHHADGTDQNYAQVRITGLSHLEAFLGQGVDSFVSCVNPAGCSHYGIHVEQGGLESGASGSTLWVRDETRIVGVYTHGLDACTGFASRMTKIYEDGRVRCALEHGDAYHPDGTSGCNDDARPAYSNRRGGGGGGGGGAMDVAWLALLAGSMAFFRRKKPCRRVS